MTVPNSEERFVSPLSPPVLVGAALLSSPSLLNVVQGVSPVSVALTRFLVSIVLCWMALEVLTMIIGPAPRPQPAEESQAETAQPPE
jgi:hypothetical protein